MKILFGTFSGMALGLYIYARVMAYKLKRDDDRYPPLETLEETLKRVEERRR